MSHSADAEVKRISRRKAAIVYLSDEEHKLLVEAARKEDRSLASQARRILMKALKPEPP